MKIEKYIKEDLQSLYETNEVKNAKLLNHKLGKDFFCSNMIPGYFAGNISAKTVMIMLNPGAENKNYSFKNTIPNKNKNDFRNKSKNDFSSFNEFLNEYIDFSINYGNIDFERIDNFDVKQAAFLYHFVDSEIDIPKRFWENKENKKEMLKIAKQKVLTQKLSLELIPYPSRTFKNLFDNISQAKKNYEFIKNHLQRLFEIITTYERKYIIFASKNFYNIFKAMEQSGYEVKVENPKFIEGVIKNKLYASKVTIHCNNKSINGIIAHSFPNQALPNAYDKMAKYGKFCYELLNK